MIEHDARRVLQRMLDLPIDIYKKHGRRTLVVFDEFQTSSGSDPRSRD